MRRAALALATTGLFYAFSLGHGGTLQVGPAKARALFIDFKKIGKDLKRFGQRIGKGFRRAGQAIRTGFQRAGAAIKTTAQRVGRAIKTGARKAGQAIKTGVRKVGHAIKTAAKKLFDFVKRAKDKVVATIKGFASKALAGIKQLARDVLFQVITSITSKVGFTADDIKRVIDLRTGKINNAALRDLIVFRVGELVKPIMSDKVQWLINKGLKLVQKPLDAAVSAVIGGLGSIPGVGGALAAGVHLAYSFGMDFLRDSLGKTITDLVYQKLVTPLFKRGLDALLRLGGKVKTVIEGLLAKAIAFFGTISKTSAVCSAPQALNRGVQLTKAEKDARRAQRDATLRRQGWHLERNVKGLQTSPGIWNAKSKRR